MSLSLPGSSLGPLRLASIAEETGMDLRYYNEIWILNSFPNVASSLLSALKEAVAEAQAAPGRCSPPTRADGWTGRAGAVCSRDEFGVIQSRRQALWRWASAHFTYTCTHIRTATTV